MPMTLNDGSTAPKNPPAGVKQFRAEGCLSYIVSDPVSRMAAVIDPHVDLVDDYREYLSEQGLKTVYALDTHIHADHFSATHRFRQEHGSEIGMSDLTKSRRPTLRLKHGQKLALGSLELEALQTPGHTPDSMAFRIAGMIFTGDTLFIGATGRTDFEGADPAQQWNSLQEVLRPLPGGTVVFPGHDYSELICSTVETELLRNPHLALGSAAEFIELKRREQIPTPNDEVRKRIEFNSESDPAPVKTTLAAGVTACGSASAELPRCASIGVEKYRHKVEELATDEAFIDVRERGEFAAGHIPGTINVPLSEIGFSLTSLRKSRRVFVSCLSGRRSLMAANTLSYLGLPDVVNVTGGFKAWTQAGLPVEA